MKANHDIRVDEVVPKSRPRAVAISLVVALLAFLGANLCAKCVLDRHTSNRAYWLISAKWRLLEAQTAPVDWLILGDSSGNQAVQGDRLAQKLGGSTLNLCTIADMLVVHDAWVLRRYLDRVGPPKNVVVVHVADVWPRQLQNKQKMLLGKVPLPWGSWEKAEPPLTLTPRETFALFLDRYVPLYTDNLTISRWATRPKTFLKSRMSLDAWGYMRIDSPDPKNAVQDGKNKILYFGNARKVSSANQAGLLELIRLSEEYGFRLIVAHAPVVDVLGTSPQFAVRLREMEASLRQAAGPDTPLPLVLNPPVMFPAALMQNCDHVTHPAASRYTDLLSEAILALPNENQARTPP
jgi:hypothetical protein